MSLPEADLPSFRHINSTSDGNTISAAAQRRIDWQKKQTKIRQTSATDVGWEEHPKLMSLTSARDFVKGYVFGEGQPQVPREQLQEQFGLTGLRRPSVDMQHDSLMLKQAGPRRASLEGLPMGYKPCSYE